jgi:hypothetical protein
MKEHPERLVAGDRIETSLFLRVGSTGRRTRGSVVDVGEVQKPFDSGVYVRVLLDGWTEVLAIRKTEVRLLDAVEILAELVDKQEHHRT